jgi:hypothetical protein
MDWQHRISAAIMATSLMTIACYLLALTFRRRWAVLHMLATLLAGRSPEGRFTPRRLPYAFALLLHYGIGLGFVMLHEWLLDCHVLYHYWENYLLFGLAAGAAGVAGWKIILVLHPAPPYYPRESYLFVIFLSHLVFALGLLLNDQILTVD